MGHGLNDPIKVGFEVFFKICHAHIKGLDYSLGRHRYGNVEFLLHTNPDSGDIGCKRGIG